MKKSFFNFFLIVVVLFLVACSHETKTNKHNEKQENEQAENEHSENDQGTEFNNNQTENIQTEPKQETMLSNIQTENNQGTESSNNQTEIKQTEPKQETELSNNQTQNEQIENKSDTVGSFEITKDNWQEYFELKHIALWNKNAFGEVEELFGVAPVLVLKDKYSNKVISTDTKLAIEYSTTLIWKYVSSDIDSLTYTWEDEMLRESVVSETDKYYPPGAPSMYTEELAKEGVLITLREADSVRFTPTGATYPYYEDFTVTRIEGTIVFK